MDIVVDYNVPPAIVNVTLQSPGTFTITFHNAIDASSVDINDFAINGIVYTGTASVSGAVVTLSTSGIFATDDSKHGKYSRRGIGSTLEMSI